MKKCISILLLIAMMLSLCGCSEAQTKTLDDTLRFIGDTWNNVSGAATESINYLGKTLNLNGEYATTVEALQVYADEFRNTVTDKLETIDPQLVEMLNGKLADIGEITEKMGTAMETVPYSETTSSTYFTAFDGEKFDIEYTTYIEGKGFVYNHIVTGDDKVYSNTFDLSFEGKDGFDLLGLTFNAYENGTWYSCNQLLHEKKALSQYPTNYNNLAYILGTIRPDNFYSSTINNLISIADGVTVDSFKDGDTEIMVIYTDGNLSAFIVMENGEITGTLLVQSLKLLHDDKSKELLNAATDYKVST